MPQSEKKVVFTNQQCVGCNRCITRCPSLGANYATVRNGTFQVLVNNTFCVQCGKCKQECSHSVRQYTDDTTAFFDALKNNKKLALIVSPALYTNERKYATRVVGSGYSMFILGVLLSYYMIFPLTFRFLGTYQVSGEVENMITLQSYISTLVIMSLAMGIVFEMPVLSWLFAKLGFLSADFMCRYRKHAVIIILIIAAIITPTSDIFTLLLVSLPMWILYEISIYIVKIATTCKNEITITI